MLEHNITHKYECVNEISNSRYSSLYKGYDVNYKRDVAIKKIQIVDDKNSKIYIQKIQREAKTMISLSEDNINVPIVYEHFYNQNDNCYYIVMQFIKGKTLRESYKFLNNYDFLCYMISLCQTLKVMNKHNFYHKDVKPENIIITNANKLYLIDFNTTLEVLRLGEGTANYIAPEMLSANMTCDRKNVDVFAVGVIMYEYFTSITPKKGSEYSENKRKAANVWKTFREPKEINNSIPDCINDIIVKCMKYNPIERYNSQNELIRDLSYAKKYVRKKY